MVKPNDQGGISWDFSYHQDMGLFFVARLRRAMMFMIHPFGAGYANALEAFKDRNSSKVYVRALSVIYGCKNN